MDKFDIIFLVCLIIAVLNLLVLFELSQYTQAPDSALLYNDAFFNKEMKGAYMPKVGFFVDTRGRNLEQINKTLHHEMLHALIMQDNNSRAHFCGDN